MQGGVAPVRLDNPIEKFRADDAAAAPDGGDVAEVEVPLLFTACRTKKLHPLRVGNDFGRIKRVTHCID